LIRRKTFGGRAGYPPPLMRSRWQRRLGGCLTLAVWLFALACTSAYACDLGAPVPQEHDCCVTTVAIDAQCSTHCGFEGQAPVPGRQDVASPALAVPALRVAVLAPAIRAHPPPDASGAAPPLAILLHRLRN
jgi:hypothetical protein